MSLLRSRGKRKGRLLPKRGGAGKQSAKEIIALLVAMVVLVALGVAQHLRGRLLSQQREDPAGNDDSLLAEGLDGLVDGWETTKILGSRQLED